MISTGTVKFFKMQGSLSTHLHCAEKVKIRV